MHSRVTQLEIDTMRAGVDEAAQLFREEVLPELCAQAGYLGVVALATPEGKGAIITFWETEEEARDASGFASTQLERYVTIFRSPPGRETYEVMLAEIAGIGLAHSR